LVLVLINPGTSLDESVVRRERVAFESFYATGTYTPVLEYFRFRREQEDMLPRNRQFIKIYEDVFGIDFERIALINVAWCPTLGDKYPKWMLDKCMKMHTLSLLHALDPDAVLLSGKATHSYQSLLESELPKARIRPTFHYARGVLRSKAIHEGPSVRKWLEDIAENPSARLDLTADKSERPLSRSTGGVIEVESNPQPNESPDPRKLLCCTSEPLGAVKMLSPAQIKLVLANYFPQLTTQPLDQAGRTGWSWWHPAIPGRPNNRVFYATSKGADGDTYIKCPQSARLSGNRAVSRLDVGASEVIRMVEHEIALYLGESPKAAQPKYELK
jgi:hypothetical protein